MIWLFAIDDEDRDIERRTSEHVNIGRFFLWSLFVLGVVIGLSTPIYLSCLARTRLVVSKTNLQFLHQGVLLYAAANDDGLPPVYELAAADTPRLDSQKRPITWATQVMGYIDSSRFRNPKTQRDAQTIITDITPKNKGGEALLGYGMTLSLSTGRLYDVSNRGSVLFAESMSTGKSGSLNPLPLKSRQDGFMIGFDDTNLPGGGPTRVSEFATRLAFTRSSESTQIAAMQPLHLEGTIAISVDGSLIYLKPSDQFVQKAGTLPTGLWAPFR